MSTEEETKPEETKAGEAEEASPEEEVAAHFEPVVRP